MTEGLSAAKNSRCPDTHNQGAGSPPFLDNGLEYASIATGTAEVFLRVREEDPETIYYYLTEPKLDVANGDDFGFRYPFTAVSRLFSFTLMAMHSDVRS